MDFMDFRRDGPVFRWENGSLHAVLVATWPSGHELWRYFNDFNETTTGSPWAPPPMLFDMLEPGAETCEDAARKVILGLSVLSTLDPVLGYQLERAPTAYNANALVPDSRVPGETRWFLEQLAGLAQTRFRLMAKDWRHPHDKRVVWAVKKAQPVPGELLQVDPAEVEAYLLLGEPHPLLWPSPRFEQWAQERWP
jgi:hypothetical protein